jgi:N-acetylmuramoyl-L-alanine amidase
MARSIAISSGHGKYVRGASGYLDEVDEARRVVDRVYELLQDAGVTVHKFHDDVSHSQSENLHRITDWHNSKTRDLDVSVHFNAYQTTSKPMGTEVLYVTQDDLASEMSGMIADAGHFINRGGKYRGDLHFLNATEEPAVLVETCFVDSSTDADLYRENFEAICRVIAEVAADVDLEEPGERPPIERPPVERPPLPSGDNRLMLTARGEGNFTINVNDTEVVVGSGSQANGVTIDLRIDGDVVVSVNGQDLHTPPTEVPDILFSAVGACSWFGGPEDDGVAPDEGLAFLFEVDDAPTLFLPVQPPGTTGLARRLNPDRMYVACRWDYEVTPKDMLADQDKFAVVTANGRSVLARPADWGPHHSTKRAADLSPGLMEALGIATEDVVTVEYPVSR